MTSVLVLALLPLVFDVDADGGGHSRQQWIAPRRLEAAPSALAPTASAFLTANSAPEGDMPHELAFLPDGSAVVIANRDSDALAFFDVNTRTVTHSVDVGDYPVQVAVTPNGQYALAPCVFSNAVSVVDVATHALVANVPITGLQPFKVAVTPNSAFAVVAVINDAINSSFSVIDLATLTEVAVIPTTGQGVVGGYFTPEAGISGNFFTRFALSPDGTTIVLPDTPNARVMIYDRATAGLVATIATAANPTGVDVASDGTRAVVSHDFNSRTVSVIDLVTRTLSASWTGAIDYTDRLVRITPDKSHAIVAALNNTVFVNLATGAVAANISTGTVGDLEITFDGQYLFVPNFNARIIDIPTRTLVKTITFASCYDGATSPTQRRAVALNNRFREDVHVYDVNGVSGFLEGFALSGPPPEGDATRSIAVSGDGRVAVAGNDTSRNATVFDLVTGQARAWIDTGDRPLGVAVTPDGTTAVVCNGDADTVSILDLGTDTRVANLSVVQRPAVVAVSPDSQWAYVLSVAGTDRIHFIHLQGAASTVVSSILTGQTGSANGYAYTGLSGMCLSPDGSILAVCLSFDDKLQLIDTATRTEIVRVDLDPSATNVFPYQCAWKPDGTRCYVINSFGDSVSVVSIAGAASSLAATVTGIDFPSTVNVDASGSFVYVADANGNAASKLRVISTASNSIVANVALANKATRAAHLSPLDGVIHLAVGTATGGELVRVQANGTSSSLINVTPLSASPAEMAFSESLRSAVIAQPIPDGVDALRFDLVSTYCIAAPNSFGTTAQIGYAGTTSVSINDFTVTVTGASPNAPGLFFYGTAQVQAPFGDGFRCVAGTVFRLGPPTPANGTGGNQRFVNFTIPPASGGPGLISPGITRYFQYWYRNIGGPGGTGFNLSNGLSVTFSP